MDLLCVMKVPFLSSFGCHESFPPYKIHAESVFFFVEKKSFQKDRVFMCHGCNKINGLMATDVFFLLIGVPSCMSKGFFVLPLRFPGQMKI